MAKSKKNNKKIIFVIIGISLIVVSAIIFYFLQLSKTVSVSSDNGIANLEFSKASLPWKTSKKDITIKSVSPTEFPKALSELPQVKNIEIQVYELGPDNITFKKPIRFTTTLKSMGSILPMIYYIFENNETVSLEPVANISTSIDPDSGEVTVSGSIEHFSEIVVIGGDPDKGEMRLRFIDENIQGFLTLFEIDIDDFPLYFKVQEKAELDILTELNMISLFKAHNLQHVPKSLDLNFLPEELPEGVYIGNAITKASLQGTLYNQVFANQVLTPPAEYTDRPEKTEVTEEKNSAGIFSKISYTRSEDDWTCAQAGREPIHAKWDIDGNISYYIFSEKEERENKIGEVPFQYSYDLKIPIVCGATVNKDGGVFLPSDATNNLIRSGEHPEPAQAEEDKGEKKEETKKEAAGKTEPEKSTPISKPPKSSGNVKVLVGEMNGEYYPLAQFTYVEAPAYCNGVKHYVFVINGSNYTAYTINGDYRIVTPPYSRCWTPEEVVIEVSQETADMFTQAVGYLYRPLY